MFFIQILYDDISFYFLCTLYGMYRYDGFLSTCDSFWNFLVLYSMNVNDALLTHSLLMNQLMYYNF